MLTTNSSTRKQEQQLLIRMPANPDNPKQSLDTAQMQQTFFKKLQQHASKHQVIIIQSTPPIEYAISICQVISISWQVCFHVPASVQADLSCLVSVCRALQSLKCPWLNCPR